MQLLRSARSRDSDAAARLLALLHRGCVSMPSMEAPRLCIAASVQGY